jgi:hypothetical protein
MEKVLHKTEIQQQCALFAQVATMIYINRSQYCYEKKMIGSEFSTETWFSKILNI